MRKNILITGIPGSGKSTLLKRIVQKINPKVGFITNEVRKDGKRIGFELETHMGKKSTLASADFKTTFKVSRYFVDTKNLEKIIPEVNRFNKNDFLFLDEIGQMELFSEKFKILVEKYFNSSNTCLATISKIFNDEFTETIKKEMTLF